MQSTIAICNTALSAYLGAAPISSMDEASPEAEECKRHYDQVRRSLLQRWPWVFASRREALVERAINDRAGAWAYSYARPAHLLSVQWVNSASAASAAFAHGRSNDAPREMTADAIYSNVPDAVIEYTRDETDPTLFTPAFADVLAASLAAAIAMPMTRDNAKKREAQQDAANLLNQAMVLDFNTRPPAPQEYIPEALRVRGIGSEPVDQPLPMVKRSPLPDPAPTPSATPYNFAALFDEDL